MKSWKLCLVGLLTCALLVPPVDARPRRHGGRRGSSTAGIVLGVIATAAAVRAAERQQQRYDTWRHGTYPVYGAPVYGRCMVPGAATFTDEGAFRNYRDVYGRYLGRVPLHAIPPGYW